MAGPLRILLHVVIVTNSLQLNNCYRVHWGVSLYKTQRNMQHQCLLCVPQHVNRAKSATNIIIIIIIIIVTVVVIIIIVIILMAITIIIFVNINLLFYHYHY